MLQNSFHERPRRTMKGNCTACVLALMWVAAGVIAEDSTDLAMVEKVATELAAAAPIAKADDKAAYAATSRNLADSKLLTQICAENILWGGQTAGKNLKFEEHNLNKFDNRAWR